MTSRFTCFAKGVKEVGACLKNRPYCIICEPVYCENGKKNAALVLAREIRGEKKGEK